MYHKHWYPPEASVAAAPTNSTAIGTTALGEQIDKSIEVNKASILQEQSPPFPEPQALIKHLPTELLLAITAYLEPVEKASLALTCLSLIEALGVETLLAATKAGSASWYRHAEMLDLLQRDTSSDKFWRCPQCLQFHDRRIYRPNNTSSGWRLSSMFNAKWREESKESSLLIGPSNNPVYIVDFNLVKAAMDRHFAKEQGVGVCLNMLKCQGAHTFPFSEVTNIMFKYEHTPKIVLDKLLLRSTYTFQPQDTMFIRNIKVNNTSHKDLLEKFDWWICGHTNAKETAEPLVQNPWKVQSGKVHHHGRCNYCPTQYATNALPHLGFRIRVWQNLGSGDAKDLKWAHISGRENEGKTYKWGQQNVREAFERLLCSTIEEFAEQWERSDGCGKWYDPELQQRAYRTLPWKAAEWV